MKNIIEFKYKLTQFYSNNKLIEVGYKFLSVEPENYKLHDSAKVFFRQKFIKNRN